MKKLCLLVFFSTVSLGLFSQNYTVLGSSSQLGSCNSYQITPNSGGQAGAIFQNQTINMNNSFDFTFSNFFGCNGASGADGEAFVLTTNPNGLGNQGEGLGYGGSNQPCSFAIEFDTWQNGNHGDPPYDHTAFEAYGSVDHNVAGPVAALPTQANLDDCNWHTIHITWDVSTNTMSVYIDGSLRISQVFPNFIGNYLCGSPNVNWGWTGSTGGGWNLQQVRILSTSNWVAGINYQSCTRAIQFNDISTSSVGALSAWHWTFGDGGTSTLQNPLHTYPSTGSYNASLIVTDATGCNDTFSHVLTINPPIVLTPTVTNPPCNGGQNGSISVGLTGGFGVAAGHGGFTYTWNNGNPFATNSGLSAGTYTLTVTDGVCSATGNYTVGQPTALTASTSSTAANCGLANGSCTVVISGGTPPYSGVSFAGNAAAGGPNSFTASGFLGGTYIANFHDANGCSALLQYTATVASLPCGISSSTSTTNVTCFGGSNGTATLTVTGAGTSPPSTISWTHGGVPAGSGATISNLVAGTYNYTYSDQNGANTFSGSITISQPGAAFTAGLATTNISCAGLNNGQAVASVTSGGIAPFSYAWSGGQPNNPVASNLGQGGITVTVSDATGCTAQASGSINSAPPLAVNITAVNNSCTQSNSGSATANVTGGTAPYQYTWSNIASGQTDYNLTAGTYTVTVTDNASCTISKSTSISSSPPLFNTVGSTNVNCYGDSTATITVNTSGGLVPYSYSWSSDPTGTVNPNLTGANLSTLKAGTYFLTVSDAGGCLFSDTIAIAQPASALSVTTAQQNVTCYGANNGYLALAVSGGTSPYTYAGSAVAASGLDTIRNLGPGVQSGTVLDFKGCSVPVSVTITSPAADSIVITKVDNLCNGASTGSATANFVNANGAVVYHWSNNQSGATISNLAANTYTVTATDANSCVLTKSATIAEPAAISLQVAQTDNNCYNGAAGTITINTTGGTGPAYTYNWNPNVSSTNAANSLAAGPYAITVTDQNLCTKTTSVTITQPAQPMSAVYNVTDVACFGNATGSINITTVNHGVSPYAYTWNPPAVSNNNLASNLSAGSYAVTITDANGCTTDSSLTIAQPLAALSVTSLSNNLSCFGSNDGSASVNPAGGTTPYTYAWTGNTSSTGPSATGLTAGSYSVLVTDNQSCTATQSFALTQPAAISLQITKVDNSCYGTSVGSITIAASGGAGAPFTYTWNPNVSTTNSATALPAGQYAITVTDLTSCSKDTIITITQPPQPITATFNVTDVACFGGNTGNITISNTINGVGPYTYTWTPAGTSNSNIANNLTVGNYAVTIADQNGCTKDSSFAITQPNAALTLDSAHTDLTCFGSNDGTATVTALGGTSPYTYTWTGNTNSTASTATGLTIGNYSVLVTDNHNCTATQGYVIVQPTAITAVIASQTNTLCSNTATGAISYTVSGGTGGYAYTWSGNVSTTSSANNILAGTYTTTFTDASGCSITKTATITSPPAIAIQAPVVNVSCFGLSDGKVTVYPTGGTPGYSYVLTDGTNPQNSATGQYTNLAANTYTVIVTDQNSCHDTTTAVVSQPAAISDNMTVTAITCAGEGNGAVAIQAIGGTAPYNYALTGQTSNTAGSFTGLQPGKYYVVISDANNCAFNDSVTILQPTPLVISSSLQNPMCASLAPDGKIKINTTGGTAPYTFTWSKGSGDSTLQNLKPGSYHLTVTDKAGCQVQDSFTLAYMFTFSASSSPLDTIQLGKSDTLRFALVGNAGHYTTSWEDASTLACATCDSSIATPYNTTTYIATITNDSGCTATTSTKVEVIPRYDLFIPNAFSANGDGRNDFFSVYGNLNVIQTFDLKIFNRWGELVYETADPNFKWDGTYKTEKAQDGLYIYTVDVTYLDGYKPYIRKGSFTLFR